MEHDVHAFNTNPVPWCRRTCDDVAGDAGDISIYFLRTMAYCFCVVYFGVSAQAISELYYVIGITVDIYNSCRSSVCPLNIPEILCCYRARILRGKYVCLVVLMLEVVVYFVSQTNASVIHIYADSCSSYSSVLSWQRRPFCCKTAQGRIISQ